MALDNFLVQGAQGGSYSDRRLRGRLIKAVESALSSDRPPPLPRHKPGDTAPFTVAPAVAIAERASTRTTVVEVNALDRPGLLAALAEAIHRCGHDVHSAHIATFGERAVDVFYLTTAKGRKLTATQNDELRAALLEAARVS
jgi:[protein-PII] uridylyltransferase